MSVSFNRTILAGRVVRDPQMRYTTKNKPVTDIVVAINDTRMGPGRTTIEEQAFVPVTFWERLAEVVCEYVKKGAPILIEGRLRYDTWEKDGQKRSKLYVVATRIQLLESDRKVDCDDGRDDE